MSSLSSLKPERVWYYFEEICKIPRPSKKEEKIAAYLVDFGKNHQLETFQDEVGNVIIRKPATVGKENMKSVVLQSHIDMVCEKNADTLHDFDKDPIQAYIDGGWVKAKGTTLGADDGIGVAAQLAILEAKDIEHGPIECLFTMDEETGLTGAFALKPGVLKSSILLNLDSEDEGQLFIGCAGGKDTSITFNYSKELIPAEMTSFLVSVTGLNGGHSGDEINKGLGNSIKIINRLLWYSSNHFGLRIAELNGGNLRNAIPREAFAKVVIPNEKKNDFLSYAEKFNLTVKEELKTTDGGLLIDVKPIEMPANLIDSATQRNLLNSLYACPHGVIAMSADMPGLVETSTNLASVKTLDSEILVTTSQRSSVESSKEDVANMVASTFILANAKTKHGDGYPGWSPNVNSEILNVMKSKYIALFKKEPQVLAIHAGLECGVIGEKYPGMDMISFGPTLRGVHSPDERIEIESVQLFWDLLIAVLGDIPKI
ncbi:MAG: aminoacyl-histidine dipeptidase [Bacteroidetes bacterium]|nr:aminoacyl-histidine dipeptidase [Bacteroidota bacterium]